jgi:hypothetical protein
MLATLLDTTTRTLRIARHANAYLMALLLLVPWSGITAASDDAADALAQIESDDEARAALMQDVRAYREQIGRIEQENGAYAPGLSEQLLGLGLALQRNGDHLQAIEVFKRGVHLARINEGLYSDRQMALLQGEIASQVAIGEYEKPTNASATCTACKRKHCLTSAAAVRWYSTRYGSARPTKPALAKSRSRVWCACGAFTGWRSRRFRKPRGRHLRCCLPPLYGMLRSQYLISGFVGETSSPDVFAPEASTATRSRSSSATAIRATSRVAR